MISIIPLKMRLTDRQRSKPWLRVISCCGNLSMRLLLISLVFMCSIAAFPYDIAVENADGKTIYYNYSNDGTELTVVRKWAGDLTKTSEYSGKMVIPSEVTYGNRTRKVTSIDHYAFFSSDLSSVVIPNSVTTIGEHAFMSCMMQSITIPNSVTSIGTYAFNSCKSLISISIPNNVKTIGRATFFGCSSLTSVMIPNGVESIGEYAFNYCASLTSVTIPSNVITIGAHAFDGCTSLTSVTIPSNVITIGAHAFDGCTSLKNLTISNGVCYIGESAFRNCSSLTSLTIPNSVKGIGKLAFNNIDLTSVISMIETPMDIGGRDYRAFSEYVLSNCILYIPIGTYDKYRARYGWGFLHIEEGIPNGITDIDKGKLKERSRFTMDGKQVIQSQKGINIIKYADGTTRKVMCK